MFGPLSARSEGCGNHCILNDDNTSREQRWSDTIEKIKVSYASSVQDNENIIVNFGGGASAPINRYFPVLSAPGTTIYSNSSASPATGSTWKKTFSEWIRFQIWSATGEASETKQYFERSVRILHSLVLKTIVATVTAGKAEMEVAVHPDLITADNIMVYFSPDVGEAAHFIQTESDVASNMDDPFTKYRAMRALGRVAYEIFMRGVGPPLPSIPLTLSSFGDVAHISLRTEEHDKTVQNQAKARHQVKRRRTLNGNHCKITNAMTNSGVPFPLCRFVVDLIGGECRNGVLFRSDNSFHSFSDVLADLKQMAENPEAFIHLSIKDQWLLSFGKKMHGRESEKKMIMDAASRVTGKTPNDALFEALALLLPQNKQQVVLVSGKAGSGKTRLIMETWKSLENQEWLFLSCKFDRIIHSEPLSVIADAFDEFLENSLRNSRQQMLCAAFNQSMLPGDLSILSTLVPCLTNYFVHPLLPSNNVEVKRAQIHQLLVKLFRALSATGHPIVFFVDNLQWADAASIDLFLALSESIESDLSSSGHDAFIKSNTLFIGSYRDNEIDDKYHVAQMLDKLKSSPLIEITDVTIGGFDQETLNRIIAESLCLPLRRTLSLSEVILQKTDGIVVHMIEFIRRLTTERILYHSFVKGWEWDNEVVQYCPTESVAEWSVSKLNKGDLVDLQEFAYKSDEMTQVQEVRGAK